MKKIILLIMIISLLLSSFVYGIEKQPGEDLTELLNLIVSTNFDISDLLSLNLLKMKETQESTASLIFTGDVCFGSPFGQKLRFDDYFEDYGPSYFFEDLKEITDNTDGYFINLENPVTESIDYTKKIWTYKAHSIDYLDILSTNNIKWANVMNNHSHDYKQKGLDDTIKYLEERDIVPVGTNITKSWTNDNEIPSVQMERREIIEINGIKVGTVGYVSFYQNKIPSEKVKEDIAYLKANSDYVVINMHWGNCNTQTVSTLQRTRAHEFIDYGADLIIGNHPHVLQEVEDYHGSKIYYSLGNLIFAHSNSVSDTNGLLVDLQLTKENGKVISELVNIPLNWAGAKSKNMFKPYIETDSSAIANISRKLKTNITFNKASYLEKKANRNKAENFTDIVKDKTEIVTQSTKQFDTDIQNIYTELKSKYSLDYSYVGYYVEDLTSKNVSTINNDLLYDKTTGKTKGKFSVASTVKLPLAFVLLKYLEENDISIDTNVKDELSGKIINLKEQLRLMISESNNRSFNYLLRYMTVDSANAYLEKYGIINSTINAELGGGDPFWTTSRVLSEYGTLNNSRFTPEDYGKTLKYVYDGVSNNNSYMEYLNEILLLNIHNTRIPKGIDYKYPVAHKTGTYTKKGKFADAGIVYVPEHPYILVMTLDEQWGNPSCESFMREFTKEVNNYLEENSRL